jgi:hypothetical protein
MVRYAPGQTNGAGRLLENWCDDSAAAWVGSPEPGVWALRRPIGTLRASRALEQLWGNVTCTGYRGLRRRNRTLKDRAASGDLFELAVFLQLASLSPVKPWITFFAPETTFHRLTYISTLKAVRFIAESKSEGGAEAPRGEVSSSRQESVL